MFKKLALYGGVFVGVILVYAAVNRPPKDEVQFAFKECLKLEEGETRMELDDQVKQKFKDCCFISGVQQPLNRAVKGNLETFISIGFETNPVDYGELMKNDPTFSILATREASTKKKFFYHFLMKRGNQYIFRTTYTEPKFDTFIIYDVVHPDSAKIAGVYNDDTYLTKKLSCGKN